MYPLFPALTPAELVALLGSARVRTNGDDHRLIFRQGDDADGLYLILSGEVDLFSYDVSVRRLLDCDLSAFVQEVGAKNRDIPLWAW
ncbi:MAG: cyclic nucleotide-binding domain-containing protein [Candidatus Riflebacteria bacterium]|nr:cyclic nucleotide-binding domain-containing protein [Candidatus Riflebacteria bacterium]